MKKTLLFAGAMLCIHLQYLTAQDTVRAEARLTAATVYYGYGASLTHQTRIVANAATRQIVIGQLSTSIDINSLQINVPENVALLSQQFSVYTPSVAVIASPVILKMQDSIRQLQRDQARNNNLADIERETLDKTNKLVELAMKENAGKVITSDEAIKLINANTAKIEKAKAALYRLKEENEAFADKIAAIQERISKAENKTAVPQKSYGQLTLQVICSAPGEIPVTFSYFTNQAGFTPLYDVRVNSTTNEIKLVYKASVTQSTGIDWKQTKLTLSTANPGWGGTAPVLTAWYLQQYVKPLYDAMKAPAPVVYNTIQSIDEKMGLQEVVVSGYGSINRKDLAGATVDVDPSSIQRYTTLAESQLNTNFEIDLPYNIESDGQVHSVTIKEEKIAAVLKDYAVPKMDKDAYLLAEIAHWQNLDLLPGAANIIMDNTYIGKSSIDPNNTADTMNLSLGKDKRIAVTRVLVKEFAGTKVNGAYVKKTFTYELSVKNNKLTTVDMLLKDQHPVSNIKDIEVKLEDDGGALVNEETGVLTWKLTLKPGESIKKRFSYTVRYPKEIAITNL